jgi:protein-disulfide isomerase
MAKRVVRKAVTPQETQIVESTATPNLPKVNAAKVLNLVKKINTNQLLVILLILAAFLIGVLVTKIQYLEKGGAAVPTAQNQVQQAGQAQQGLQPGQKVDVKVGSLPVLGKDNAKVTVIEFADFQCPFCDKWYTESGKNLIKDYVNTGKIKFAYRHFAFLGDESNWSAEASECANEQGKFWQFHDYLFEHQNGENQGAFAKDKLKGFAQILGLNTAQFNTCLDSGKYTTKVTDDTAAGQTAGVSGTPTIFVNGQALIGAQPYTALKTLIDQELSK